MESRRQAEYDKSQSNVVLIGSHPLSVHTNKNIMLSLLCPTL